MITEDHFYGVDASAIACVELSMNGGESHVQAARIELETKRFLNLQTGLSTDYREQVETVAEEHTKCVKRNKI